MQRRKKDTHRVRYIPPFNPALRRKGIMVRTVHKIIRVRRQMVFSTAVATTASLVGEEIVKVETDSNC